MPVAKPINYWDGRPPKTHILDTGSTQQGPAVIEYVDRQRLFPAMPPGSKIKLILDETISKTIGNDTKSYLHPTYTIWQGQPPVAGDQFGILYKPVKGMTMSVGDGTDPPTINHQYTPEAVILLQKHLSDPNDTDSEHKIEAQSKLTGGYGAINLIWPTDIPAGDWLNPPQGGSPGDDALAPVIVVGYVDIWNVSGESSQDVEKKPVFVIRNVIFPVTIIKGNVDYVTGSFELPAGYQVLWGKDPHPPGANKSIKDVINPFGAGQGYALIMQTPSGQFQCIDLGCPPENPPPASLF